MANAGAAGIEVCRQVACGSSIVWLLIAGAAVVAGLIVGVLKWLDSRRNR